MPTPHSFRETWLTRDENQRHATAHLYKTKSKGGETIRDERLYAQIPLLSRLVDDHWFFSTPRRYQSACGRSSSTRSSRSRHLPHDSHPPSNLLIPKDRL